MEFIAIIFPVLIVIGIGFIGQRFLAFNAKEISKMAVYIMMPILALKTFYDNEIGLNYLYYGVFALSLCLGLIAIVYLLSALKKYTSQERSSLILSSAFMNNGNYGTPVALYAFGITGFEIAVILMVIQQLIMYTVGVYYAANGSEQEVSIKKAFKAVLHMPVLYGALLGIILQLSQIDIPLAIYRSIELVSEATIPTVMLVLGLQLGTIRLKKIETEKVMYSISIKLLLAPIIAFLIVMLLPLSLEEKALLVLMAAMPSAANTTMFALQFNTKPEFVSSVTLLSTICSVITLPLILYVQGLIL